MENLKKNQKLLEDMKLLNKPKKSKKFGMDLKKITKSVLYIIIGFMLVNILSFNSVPIEQPVKQEMVDTTVYVQSVKDTFKVHLITEVDNYIKEMAPTSELNSEYLVEKCLEYNTDIVFVLSQALLESHFGTKGKAAETNSVWNVGTYDNGKILYRYDNPNESIEPYLKLINEKYLINVTEKGDTVFKDLRHLVEDKGYINYNGDRFATARGYENGIRKIMIRIDLDTKISFYQQLTTLSSSEIVAYFMPTQYTDVKKLYAYNKNTNGNINTIKREIR